MSAPDTNTKRQEKKHKPSLFGTKGAIIAVLVIGIGMVAYNMMKPEVVTQETPSGAVATENDASGTNSSTQTGTDPAATSTVND